MKATLGFIVSNVAWSLCAARIILSVPRANQAKELQSSLSMMQVIFQKIREPAVLHNHISGQAVLTYAESSHSGR